MKDIQTTDISQKSGTGRKIKPAGSKDYDIIA